MSKEVGRGVCWVNHSRNIKGKMEQAPSKYISVEKTPEVQELYQQQIFCEEKRIFPTTSCYLIRDITFLKTTNHKYSFQLPLVRLPMALVLGNKNSPKATKITKQ